MQDYHIHTKLCRHATGDIVDYAEAAVAKGFAEIGFSEHIPIPNLK
ncbi:MAG: PHP domain-containing protein [candidate division KSB1 bacterium]|nr:PHP domain-containing protein [candidate division KSB1 bacterium]